MLAIRKSGLLQAVVKGQGDSVRALASVAAWKTPKPSKKERIDTWDYVNSIYFGPERDMKNFPNPSQPKEAEPVRLGIFPAKWFDFFYPKTGVSGGYVFLGGLSVWMLSKEVMVIDHDFWSIPGFWGMIYIFHKTSVAEKLSKFISDKTEAIKREEYTHLMEKVKAREERNLATLERFVEETQAAEFVNQAKREGVAFQLEAAYRQRLLTAYQEVKKRLDYEVEKENIKRKFEHDHMVNWIVQSVTKSITPQQEAESIKSCIATLKQLASKQQSVATA